MEIFHISAECYPVAKVGGLADSGVLPKYQNKSSSCKSCCPCYDVKFRQENEFECVHWDLSSCKLIFLLTF
jgi:starch synthase